MRKTKFLTITLATAAIGLGINGAAMAADGAALYQSKACMGCHGAEGKKPILPTYPKLAGQSEQYALQQMKDIKSGKRNNGLSAQMKAVMAAVSEEDMAAIAKWLSTLN